ncbi:DUF2026 family protein [Profundibacter amoris]|uniref:DUF2026 domain-containing protein n=1 Tax=Profundibacter amoris TaxID=2171755 RepID=A0A347UCD0_9RHOB|nr:DUF2026 family protein [Profundibacter amoris]AXX96508.1 DUF2026 domain-containing protein [Profundibacter amoris]
MLIKLRDYERIYNIIRSVIANEGSETSGACAYFSAFGAYILTKHYNLDPELKCGLAAFYTGGNHEVILFGEEHNGTVTGALDNFHCWIEVDGWAIDFMAPEFSKFDTGNFDVPTKMFQKRLGDMASNINDMAAPGDFFFSPNTEKTQLNLEQFTSKIGYSDLAEICSSWFRKCPKKIPPKIMIGDGKGNNNLVTLSGPPIKGRW